MKINELKRKISEGALEKYAALYPDTAAAGERFTSALDAFALLYGEERDVVLLSVPGRCEIIGNHTDHNAGRVIAGAITRDVITVAAVRDDGIIRLKSEGYPEDTLSLSEAGSPESFERFSSRALIAGTVAKFIEKGYPCGGFDAYTSSLVLKGSGLSSSAAFEVSVGNILNHLYADGTIPAEELAYVAQYAENEYFGKPSGLMDQMACAVGGFVFIDFESQSAAKVEPIRLSLREAGYALCVINTRGSHADLNDEYAAIPNEMRAVAAALGHGVLRGVTERDIYDNMPTLRSKLGDRAILRAIHFIREDLRAEAARAALSNGDVSRFLRLVCESGDSSYKYLQNIYAPKCPCEQGLSLALALTDGFLAGSGAYRVQGGGFAGTILAFVPTDRLADYTALMDGVFGEGATSALDVRPLGAVKLF